MDIENAPDPTETVRVLKSDFDLLQSAANAAYEDFLQMCELLQVTPAEGVAPRQVMYDDIFPRIVALLATQQHVDEATSMLQQRASRFGNKTIELANGVKGLQVGQKIPGLFDDSRRARREAEREARRRGR